MVVKLNLKNGVTEKVNFNVPNLQLVIREIKQYLNSGEWITIDNGKIINPSAIVSVENN